jgi:hypothetical protein
MLLAAPMRFLQNLRHGIRAVVLAAAFFSARRAARVNPTEALRLRMVRRAA